MKRHWLGASTACMALLSFAVMAQTALPPAAQTATQADRDASLHQPLDQVPLTGTPNGTQIVPGRNTTGFPVPQMIEGKPLEARAPEKPDDKPLFTAQTRAPYRKTVDYNVTTLVPNLHLPWSLAFLPDGKMLVTQKSGELLIVDQSGKLSAPVKGVPAVNTEGQVGLLDVVLDRNFSRNRRIFFSYSERVGVEMSNIVVARATFDQAGGTLTNVQKIYTVKPTLPRMQVSNEGGRIAIDRKGNLFVTVGDRSKSPPWLMAQRLDTALGKVIHITPDGKAVPGGPFAKTPGALPEIYSIGHRSEEGLAFDSKGQLWEIEHGPRGGDELNLIQPGGNYGWPVITHAIDYPGFAIGDGITARDGMEQPVYYWDPVIAPSGLAFYTGDLFPAWKNSVFVGGLRGMQLARLTINADNKVVDEEPLLLDQKVRVRDVRVGPDGAVYVLTDSVNGKLFKLTPK